MTSWWHGITQSLTFQFIWPSTTNRDMYGFCVKYVQKARMYGGMCRKPDLVATRPNMTQRSSDATIFYYRWNALCQAWWHFFPQKCNSVSIRLCVYETPLLLVYPQLVITERSAWPCVVSSKILNSYRILYTGIIVSHLSHNVPDT